MKRLKNSFYLFIENIYYPEHDKYFYSHSYRNNNIIIGTMILLFPFWIIYILLKKSTIKNT